MGLLDHLISMKCTGVWYDEDSHDWGFCFQDDLVLVVECPWRLVGEKEVTIGWRDHGQVFGLPKPVDATVELMRAITLPVTTVDLRSPPGDLTIHFGSACRLDLFNDSSSFEGWTLNGPGRYLVAYGGGSVEERDEPEPSA